MRIAAISDLHGELIPFRDDVELHVIAGDVCPVAQSHDPFKQINWIATIFADWVASCPTHVVWIAGNHDFACETFGQKKINELVPGGIYLAHDHYTFAGIKIWGMPFILNLEGWAFNLREGQMEAAVEMIHPSTQLLLAHNPPRGVLDKPMYSTPYAVPHVGSVPLTNRMLHNRGKLNAVVCGHIHEGHGRAKVNGVDVYNVAYLNRDYDPYVVGKEAWTILDLEPR